MANYTTTITNEGAALLATVIANQGTITFNEFRFSENDYTGQESTLTEGTFLGVFITAGAAASVIDSTTIKTNAQFNNSTITGNHNLYSIGIVGTDGNTTALIAVCTTTDPDVIREPLTGVSTYAFNVNLAVSSTSNITVTGTAAGIVYDTDSIDVLADVDAPSPSNSDLLIYNGSTSKWTAQANPFSNENLLLNPFFTVNQRGFTSGTGYCADRWSTYHTSVTRNSDGTITITASSTNGNINTKIKYNSELVGKTVTLSLLYGDGTVKSGTGIVPTAGSTLSKVYFDDGRSLSIGTPDTTAHTFNVRLIEDSASDSITIHAVKLELGSISTLANDVAPDYALELAKCQTSTADPSDTYANQGQLMTSALQGELGAMNSNSYPYYETTKTENGLTFTDNGDGSITVSGTASALTEFFIHDAVNTSKNSCVLKNGNYILSGCPNGGSGETYKIGACYKRKTSGSILSLGNDFGNGASFTVDGGYYSDDDIVLGLEIVIYAGTVISTPITFKPMIRDARIIDDTFVPYAMTNRELTERVADLKETETTGTMSSGITGGLTCYKNIFFKKIKLSFYSTNETTLSSEAVIATIPNGYRPSTWCVMGVKSSVSGTYLLNINTNGEISIPKNSSITQSDNWIYGEIIYF